MNLSSSQKCFLMPLSFSTHCLFLVESPILTYYPHSHPYTCIWETIIYTFSLPQGSCSPSEDFPDTQSDSNTLLCIPLCSFQTPF